MNRLNFLKEMRASLFETVKEIYEPFVEDDLKKIDHSADQLLGICWLNLTPNSQSVKHLEQKYVAGKPILCVKDGETIRAFSGICPTCTNLLSVSTFASTCKCMHCDKDFSVQFRDEATNVTLTEYPVKQQDDGYYVGMKKSTLK
ncbi:hypothetical protein [Bacillus massiliigorillae]|uniref:hypothetical protein n=1 Tax=Bacillus massiliigorillae TaxID=1243664 RepID=UPI00039EB64D|nr:hypothetical protein [Bacillus massiliigorillae]